MANKLTKYLDELSTLYRDANKEICEHVEAIKDIEEQQNRLKASGNLTPKGMSLLSQLEAFWERAAIRLTRTET